MGKGYDEKTVVVVSAEGTPVQATTYVAIHIDDSLEPFSWYVHHVLTGALEALLPGDYIDARIRFVRTREDACRERDARERSIYLDLSPARHGRA